jgi:hypothetical protein
MPLEEADESDAATSLAEEADVLDEALGPGVVDYEVDASAVGEALDFSTLVRRGFLVDSANFWVQFLQHSYLLVGRRGDDWTNSRCYAEYESHDADPSGT